MVGHKRVGAAPEGNEEERQRVADVAEQRGSRRRKPPATVLTQAVEHVNVEDLPQRIGHKARGGDTGDEQVKVRQRAKALPLAHVKQRRNHVGNHQRGDHHRKDNTSSQRCAKNTHGEIGREEDKRKAKRAPGGVEAENRYRQLHQIVAGGDHQQME